MSEQELEDLPCQPRLTETATYSYWNPDLPVNEIHFKIQLGFENVVSCERKRAESKYDYVFIIPEITITAENGNIISRATLYKIVDEYDRGKLINAGESNKKRHLTRKGLQLGTLQFTTINSTNNNNTNNNTNNNFDGLNCNTYKTQSFKLSTSLKNGHGAKTQCVLYVEDKVNNITATSNVFTLLSTQPTTKNNINNLIQKHQHLVVDVLQWLETFKDDYEIGYNQLKLFIAQRNIQHISNISSSEGNHSNINNDNINYDSQHNTNNKTNENTYNNINNNNPLPNKDVNMSNDNINTNINDSFLSSTNDQIICQICGMTGFFNDGNFFCPNCIN